MRIKWIIEGSCRLEDDDLIELDAEGIDILDAEAVATALQIDTSEYTFLTWTLEP